MVAIIRREKRKREREKEELHVLMTLITWWIQVRFCGLCLNHLRVQSRVPRFDVSFCFPSFFLPPSWLSFFFLFSLLLIENQMTLLTTRYSLLAIKWHRAPVGVDFVLRVQSLCLNHLTDIIVLEYRSSQVAGDGHDDGDGDCDRWWRLCDGRDGGEVACRRFRPSSSQSGQVVKLPLTRRGNHYWSPL